MEGKYKENPTFIVGSLIAKALEEEVKKVSAEKGTTAYFSAWFTFRDNVFCEYTRMD